MREVNDVRRHRGPTEPELDSSGSPGLDNTDISCEAWHCSGASARTGMKRPSRVVEGAANGRTAVEDVGVDHGGFYIFVPKEFLDSTNVVSVFQELGGK